MDQVDFDEIIPDVNAGAEIHSFTFNNSGEINALYFSGVINALTQRAFALDVLFDYSGIGAAGADITLSPFVESFDGSEFFDGVVVLSAQIKRVEEGESWTFSFRDIFDDGQLGEADVSVDIEYAFVFDPAFQPLGLSSLGIFTLDDGLYSLFGNLGARHPYTAIDLEVSEDSFYSIDVNWNNGVGEGIPFDGFAFLFDRAFDGVDDFGSIDFNDDAFDDRGVSASRIDSLFLEQGVTYTVLLITFKSLESSVLQGDLRIEGVSGTEAFLVNSESELTCIPIRARSDTVAPICLDF